MTVPRLLFLLPALIALGPRLPARAADDALRVSTLFTAQDVRDRLADEAGLAEAVAWSKSLGITRVFIETFRDGYRAPRETLAAARDRFRAEGCEAWGCVTTTRIGKRSTGWNIISCFSDEPTRKELASIFAFTASLFDGIMIDDFFFTDCGCAACEKACGDGGWARCRCDLMVDVSKRDVIAAARAANPKVQIILKYPQWYDNFHNRGYDVVRQPPLFEWIWVGTETRDPDSTRWGRKAQYEAYFIMRWLGGIGGEKTGGGWFDPYGTSPPTYVEQARQTVLAGAREMLLFCYGSLMDPEAARNVDALRPELPALVELARWVKGGTPYGIPAIKPPGSQPATAEEYVFDWIGMLGIPLAPAHQIPREAPAAVATSHLVSDPAGKKFLADHLAAGRPVLATKAAVEAVQGSARTAGSAAGSVIPLTWEGDVRDVMDLPAEKLGAIRNPLLARLGLSLDAPGRVALYLPAADVIALENFADEPATVAFTDTRRTLRVDRRLVLPPGTEPALKVNGNSIKGELPPRALVVWRLAAKD
jgi:hypothetical protein